ncbi:MAG: hypothetical protein ACREKM_09965 [Longimicrobiales bacterium]
MSDSTRPYDRPPEQPQPLPQTDTAPDVGVDRARSAADRGRARVADAFDAIGERIEDRGHVMRGRGGTRRTAGKAAIRAGHAFEAGAEYLREHDVAEMKHEVETRVRQRPLASLAIAALAGFLLARIVR